MQIRTQCRNGCVVSTVYLYGIPHSWGMDGFDYYYETALKDKQGYWEIAERYKTFKEAMQGHETWVRACGGRRWFQWW